MANVDIAPLWSPTAVIYVEARCDSCGVLILDERWRPSLLPTWPAVADWWRGKIEEHAASCRATPVAAARARGPSSENG